MKMTIQSEYGLLDVLDGKYGETMSSAILAYALIEHPNFAKDFLNMASEHAGFNLGAEILEAEIEAGRSVNDKDRSRVDLLLQTAQCILGIEIKIWAGLADGQPSKYVKHLQERRQGDSDPRRLHMLVIAPEIERERVAEIVKSQEPEMGSCKWSVVSWECVRRVMAKAEKEGDPTGELSFLMKQFQRFLQQRMWDITVLSDPQAVRKIVSGVGKDSENQRGLLNTLSSRLWTEAKDGDNRRRMVRQNADKWWGFPFGLATGVDGGWCGLVNIHFLKSLGATPGIHDASCALVVCLYNGNSPRFSQLRTGLCSDSPFSRSPTKVTLWSSNWAVWVIEDANITSSIDRWNELLKPAIEYVRPSMANVNDPE